MKPKKASKNRENIGLQIIDITDIEFPVSHHGDYIRKDRPILFKSNTDQNIGGIAVQMKPYAAVCQHSIVCYILYLAQDDDGSRCSETIPWQVS